MATDPNSAQCVMEVLWDLADTTGAKIAALERAQAGLSSQLSAERPGVYVYSLDRLRALWEAGDTQGVSGQAAGVLFDAAAPPEQIGAPAGPEVLTAIGDEKSYLPQLGVDRETFAWIGGWDHVRQSIFNLITTRIFTRVFMREYGSELPRLIDRPMNEPNVLAVYVAITSALLRWEPRFVLTHCQPIAGNANGQVNLELTGTYYPRWGVIDGQVWVDKTTGETREGWRVWQ